MKKTTINLILGAMDNIFHTSRVVVLRILVNADLNVYGLFSQTMAASKRNQALPSALVARQSLNDEELVRNTPSVVFSHYQQCFLVKQTYFV